ncbi:hypothetical protein GCM10009000_061160 [Halobacterium noricense]|uniref:Enolase C-terminal domain-containing protein n=1 Tax=Haladaptatus pallidirubidus TaxID=1008152 RepID=A0AAV3UJ29_9EURY
MGDQSYGKETVTLLVEHAAEHDVYWVEEPVDPDDYAGYRALSGNGVSLAGGESEESAEGLLELGKTDAVDYLQGDVRHHGGFSGSWLPWSSATNETSRSSHTTSGRDSG